MIPYGKHEITSDDIEAVNAVLKSSWLTQGPAVPAFESMVSQHCGAKHAIAVNSATSALHIAMLSIGLKDGDCLWTVPNTFVASANCALYCGADVDFVDINSTTFNIDIVALRIKLELARDHKQLPKVLIVVHFGGMPCDLKELDALRKEFGFFLIEDASHAVGALYDREPVGGCRYSDITVFSFHPVKIVTSGEGGIALTNSDKFAHRMDLARSHGITRDPTRMDGHIDGPWTYQQIDIGYNYRLTDLAAALGSSQFKRLPEFVLRRTALADHYDSLLEGSKLITQQRTPNASSSWHLYVVCLPSENDTSARLNLFNHMRAEGIGVAVHYAPVHLQPFYRKRGFRPGMFPVSESYYERCLTLPLYPALAKDRQEFIVKKLRQFIKR